MLWQPEVSRIARSEMQRFMHYITAHQGPELKHYPALHRYSVEHNAEFWQHLIQYFDLRYEGELSPVNTDSGFSHYGWFPRLRLNFAENLLHKGEGAAIALRSVLENGQRRELSYDQLRQQVAQLQAALADLMGEGDVLACYMPNIPETAIAMLAATASGGAFTSTSCDFGVEGVVDRFGQSQPKVLVACTAYQYNGKVIDCTAKVSELVARVPSIQRVLMVDFLARGDDIAGIPKARRWQEVLAEQTQTTPRYHRVPFQSPLYVMYSSGTTGQPKCIVHATGGVLLQHIKEIGLHSDHQASKNLFFFTTCGWMMWNWLISGLYFGGQITLYEGSPSYPNLKAFFRIIERERITIFGTSPKFLRALEDSHAQFADVDLSSLETILCTGAPLLPEQYDFVYQKIKADVHLASISGGTDIIGCFFLGNPLSPVYRGELQCRGLGMDVVCFDESGHEVIDQEGELVCRSSFPSRPLYFLGDDSGEKLREAYFNHFPGLWYHGDFIRITSHGGAIFYGRSDATLNPGGVRIGTSEIYRQTESLAYIEDAVCVGKNVTGDVEVVLFVKLREGEMLDASRIEEIKHRIRINTTPRHVPRHVIAVKAIPYTRSGKKIELAVARIINGKAITNVEAIANPESLREYEGIV